MRSEKYAGVSSLELIVHRVSVSLQWTVSPASSSNSEMGSYSGWLRFIYPPTLPQAGI